MNNDFKLLIKTYVGIRTFIFIIMCIIVVSYTISPIKDLNQIKKEFNMYENKVTNLKSDYDQLVFDINRLNNEKSKLEETILDANGIYDYRYDTINNLSEYYSYALNYNTIYSYADFKIGDLLFLYDTCEDYGVPIEIMLAIYEKESKFYSKAKNPSSTATGYGQLIDTTAKSIYENYLQLGEYDTKYHRDTCIDKRLNILLSCRLMKYNIDTYGNYWDAVEHYYGHPDLSLRYKYAVDISSKMETYGSSLSKN